MSSAIDRCENSDSEGANGKKIRKRNGSSSSSSATLARNNRFKRAILMGKRGGFTTPAPAWDTNALQQDSAGGGKARDPSASVSARKLAATLWEIDQVPKGHQKVLEKEHRRTKSSQRHCFLEGFDSHSKASLMDKEKMGSPNDCYKSDMNYMLARIPQ